MRERNINGEREIKGNEETKEIERETYFSALKQSILKQFQKITTQDSSNQKKSQAIENVKAY